MKGPCRANALGWRLDAICPDCGHHGLVHPGPNDVPACMICELEAAVERAKARARVAGTN